MPQFQEDQNTVYYRMYYSHPERSRWMEQVWAEAFGKQYPEGLEQYGYLTRHDLDRMAAWLNVQEGATVLDMGCGKGGPGLRLAERLRLRLIGVDVIEEAVVQAREFQSKFDLAYPARFEVGNFFEIPLPDASVDAVICIDSLWAAADKIEAMREVKRVLRPGGRFVFTFWDLLALDSVPLLEQSGMRFIHCEDTPNWKENQLAVYAGLVAREQEIIEEMGAAATMLLYEAKVSPPYLDYSVRRLYVWEA